MAQPVLPDPEWIVGKHGLMNVHVLLRNGRTEMDPHSWRIPFQWQGYHYQDHDDEPYLPLVNSSGGFVEGDVSEFHALLDANTRMLSTTTSASKFYKCLEGKTSRETIDVTVGPGALFEYFTNEAIPYARSRVQRFTRIVMDLSSNLFATDLVSAGRIHYGNGEIFQFDSLVSVFEIIAGNRRLVLDRLVATERRDIEALGRLWSGAYHMGTIFAYAPNLSKGIEDLVHERSEEISQEIDDIKMGASRIGNMVVVRILSRETWQAHEAIYRVWEVLRPPIAGKPARPIRTGAYPVGIG